MEFHSDLKKRRFDRVIFNFPHAGFYGKEDNSLVIEMHKGLVLGFFKNASRMLRGNGEIHVNHKTTAPFSNWNIEELAMQSFLTWIECVDFRKEDYPGYYNKRGGSKSNRCDEPFPLGKCSTFKFIYNPRATKNHFRSNHMEVEQLPASRARKRRLRRNHMEVSRQQTYLPLQEIQKVEQLPAPVDLNSYPQTSLCPEMKESVASVFDLTNGCTPIYRDYYFNNVTKVHRRVASSADYYARDMTLQLPGHLEVEQLPAPTASRLGSNHMEFSRQEANLPFQEIQKVEQLPTPRASRFGRNHMEVSRQQANLPFQEIQKVEQLPAPVDLNNYPQASLFPKANEPVTYLANGYTPMPVDYLNILLAFLFFLIKTGLAFFFFLMRIALDFFFFLIKTLLAFFFFLIRIALDFFLIGTVIAFYVFLIKTALAFFLSLIRSVLGFHWLSFSF